MAKEMPYFRWTVSEWLNGDISMESKSMKGVFADICSYYWFKDCTMTKQLLSKRFPNDSAEIEMLIESNIIKQDGDKLLINFLDEQHQELLEISKKRALAGKKGGLASLSKRQANAKQMVKQTSSYKEKENYKDNTGQLPSAEEPTATTEEILAINPFKDMPCKKK